MRFLGRKICCFYMMMFCTVLLYGEQSMFSWDFSDCFIRDILYAVSLDTGISIVPDDTVNGKGDFRFTGNDFEIAFDSFLNASRLYVLKKGNLWTVSRFRVVENNGLYTLDACDLKAEQIVEKLSLNLKTVITYESLPSELMNMHFKDLTQTELLESICLRFTGCELETRESGFHFAKKGYKVNDLSFDFLNVKMQSDGSVIVDVKDAKVSEIIEQIFKCCLEKNELSRQYCVLMNGDSKVLRTYFVGRNFDDALEKFCIQAGLGFTIVDDVYYIYSDNGAKDRIFVEERQWKKLELKYTKAEKFVSILNRRFGKVESIVLPDEMSCLVYVSGEEEENVKQLLDDIDVKIETYLIELKYICPNDLVKYLPPDVDKSCLFVADDNSCVYFKGTEPAYLNLCKQLKICDRPVVRVSYDLLILQYEDGDDDLWSSGFNLGKVSKGDRNNIGLKLGNVMNLNFNVVSAFGLNFAAQLQNSIEKNKTMVFADTTLHGVSGKQINFQNTNTYRYRDNNLDPDTGKPIYSGVTKEIISGLKLDVVGFVSGDGMITSTVKASVARQGNDTSASTGNPPPTSEKIVTTEVCCRNGEPIIISGLVQDSSMLGSNELPYISNIPVLKWLFGSKEKIKEKSQMVIYLIPHIDEYEKNLECKEKFSEEWAKEKIDLFCKSYCTGVENECL